MVGKGRSVRREWLEGVFERYPNHKYHGFGMTDLTLIWEYPWYSVDSRSWAKGVQYGQVSTPYGGAKLSDKIPYDDPKQVWIAQYSIEDQYEGKLTKSQTRCLQNKWRQLEYFKSLGLDPQEISKSNDLRAELTLRHYIETVDEINRQRGFQDEAIISECNKGIGKAIPAAGQAQQDN